VPVLPEDRAVLREFAQRVQRVEPRARVWAFGSRARGDADPQSDLDVCVVVPDVSPPLEEELRRCAWEVAFEHGRVIPVIVLSQEAFERGPMSASTLVANIRREGVAA
jgi:predicted nucleotidyltransferase